MHIDVLGVHLVIINSEEIADELVEKRSANYSDRPDIQVMKMFVAFDFRASLKFDVD